MDKKMKVDWVNAAASRLLGISRKDIGEKIYNVITDENFQQYIRKKDFEASLECVSPENASIELEVIVREYDQNQYLLTAHDMTEIKKVESIRREFLANVAHELRTPLTAISGYTELLRDGSFGLLDERQRRPLTIIAQSTDRLLEIINNLLDVSRIETGRVQLNMRSTPLQQIIRRCLDEYHLVVEKRGQTLTVDLPSDAPLLLCDLARTVQVLGNLLGNASKYTPEGGSIHLSAGPAAQAGYFQIAVQDTGVGIPLAEQQRIFGTFYRASNADQTNAAGAGLGLHISRSLVELQGGEIHFESEPGQGSTFFFTLPLAE